MSSSDTKFFTNEEGKSLLDRFKKTLNDFKRTLCKTHIYDQCL